MRRIAGRHSCGITQRRSSLRRRYLLVRVRGNSKLPRCPLANEPDVVRGFDVEDGPFAGDDRRSTIMDLLAIVEHEVNNACCPGRFDPVSLEGPSTGSLPSNIVSRISNFFWCARHGAQRQAWRAAPWMALSTVERKRNGK